MAVAGYSLAEQPLRGAEVPGHAFIPLLGRRIEKLYAHDDQSGPFARMVVQDNDSQQPFPLRLETDWVDQHGQPYPVYPYAVIVPVYNKVRLRYIEVADWVTRFDVLASEIIPAPEHREWDLHLLLSNDYKRQLRTDQSLAGSVRESILTAHHPRFWWRAMLRLGGEPLAELLFDATGIARSVPLTRVVWRSEGFARKLEEQMAEAALQNSILLALQSPRLLNNLRTSLAKRARPFDYQLT